MFGFLRLQQDIALGPISHHCEVLLDVDTFPGHQHYFLLTHKQFYLANDSAQINHCYF